MNPNGVVGAQGRLLIGTSGYVYRDWRERLYPRTLPLEGWLGFYAGRFPTVELNSPFYRLPTTRTFRAWRQAVPPTFVFAVKASRFLTHIKRLGDIGEPLRRFLGRARALEPTLGPVLFQLPRHFHANLDRLDEFLTRLRRQRLVPDLRAVLEVRHPSWLIPEVAERLRGAGVALCLADWRDVPVTGPLTADFVYVRRHGWGRVGSYPMRALQADAEAIRRWRADGRDVYVYFNNDWRAFAVRNARVLHQLLDGAGTRRRPVRAAG